MPLSEEYGENLSLSLSPEFDDEMVHISWTLLETAWKDEKNLRKNKKKVFMCNISNMMICFSLSQAL